MITHRMECKLCIVPRLSRERSDGRVLRPRSESGFEATVIVSVARVGGVVLGRAGTLTDTTSADTVLVLATNVTWGGRNDNS